MPLPLHQHETLRDDRHADGVVSWKVWRETARRHRVVAEVEVGEAPPWALPDELATWLMKRWPSAGTQVPRSKVMAHLAAVRPPEAAARAMLRRLVATQHLFSYQRLEADGRSFDGEPWYGLGEQGLALLQQRHTTRESALHTWLESWEQGVAVLREQRHLHAYTHLRDFLWQAQVAVRAGDNVVFPNDLWASGGIQLTGTRLALDFLLAVAGLAEVGEPFDWKEIGARYHPCIGASKQFDRQGDRLAALLEAVTGDTAETLGMVSSGRLANLFGAGRLVFEIDFDRQTKPAALPWSISSDEVEAAALIEVPHLIIAVENRAILTKMAQQWWPKRTDTLILVTDGQRRLALERFLQKAKRPLLGWVDWDDAGLSIATHVAACMPQSWWVLPPDGEAPLRVAEWPQWQEAMAAFLADDERVEQEAYLGGQAVWDGLLRQIHSAVNQARSTRA